MITTLEARNKLVFIDGTLPIPSPQDPNLPLWKQGNSLIKNWITNCLSAQILASITSFKSARDLWLDLKNMFSVTNKTRVFEIYRALANIKQATLSVTDYYVKLKSYWDELQQHQALPQYKCGQCVCNTHKPVMLQRETEKVMQFLMGLNDSYHHVSSQILLMSPFPDVNVVFNLIRQEENTQQMYSSETVTDTPVAMAFTKPNNFSSNKNFRHNNTDGPKRDSDNISKSSSSNREGMYCKHCKKDNHNTEKCFRLFGFPSRKKPNNSGRSY
ncbi:uncharacterized protein LOC120009700 [Tripterygium wilfordii]|uniref:uncharacterized protein LOC120009700 n=1 Tax=Tripterygium wilfordii TaxID=458696 RepID=UPI0018F825B0|nr:uncharacterized protein LOC120009700 [Tripterygium wilfordii]